MSIFNSVGGYNDEDISEYMEILYSQTQQGLKLNSNDNYDIEQKRLENVREGVDNDVAITKHQMKVGLLTKPNPTDALLLNGKNHMAGDSNMDNYRIYNLANPQNDTDAVAKLYVDLSFYKKDENIDLQEKYNVTKSKQQSFTYLKENNDNLVSFNDVNDIFLSREESYPIKANLNMGNNIIHNVNNDRVVNKGYVDQADTNLQNNIDQQLINVSKEFVRTQKLLDSKSDKSYVDTKITNQNIIILKQKIE